REIENNVDPYIHQLDLVHAIRDSLFMMWMDSASKEERDQMSGRMKAVLQALVNSVKKHIMDKDMGALSSRIDKTLNELEALASELESSGYQRAARFIRAHAGFMVTFARVAISEGKRIPYTSNAIERLMAEIMRRCKHIWARWSDRGLENILKIRLLRMVEPKKYKEFCQSYIHPVVRR
ncbi:MAG: ISH6 family transposase, partial [Nitrososphaeria archaeon]